LQPEELAEPQPPGPDLPPVQEPPPEEPDVDPVKPVQDPMRDPVQRPPSMFENPEGRSVWSTPIVAMRSRALFATVSGIFDTRR
jgi:hypothetical protein